MENSDSGLTHLPTELILKICKDLPVQDILRLATVCRRLCAIAALAYLRHLGMSDPGTQCIVRPSYKGYGDELTALLIGCQLVAVKHFTCILSIGDTSESQPPHSERNLEALTWNLRRVRQFIGRLTSIGSVCLIFHTMGATWSLESKAMQQFTVSFLQLLSIAMLKSCTSLHIHYSSSVIWEPNYQFQVVRGSVQTASEWLKRCLVNYLTISSPKRLRGKGWKYSKTCSLSIKPAHPPILEHSNLTHVSLKCDSLLVPPLSPWIFRVLKSSPVRSLTLSLPRRHAISTEEYRGYIFPRLVDALPLLEELKLAFFNEDSLRAAINSLPLFPLLRDVVFAELYSGNFPSVIFPRAQATLSNLISFTASTNQAVYFFGHPFEFPELKFVNIIVYMPLQLKSQCKATATQFFFLSNRFAMLGIKPCISVLSLDQPRSYYIPPTVFGPDEETSVNAHEFREVSRLNVGFPVQATWDYQTEIKHLSAFALRWLRVFCGVDTLILTLRRRLPSSFTPQMRAEEVKTAIAKECPGVHVVNIFDVPETFRPHWTSTGMDCEGSAERELCLCSGV